MFASNVLTNTARTFVRSSRSNPCPVCGSTDTKCRFTDDSLNSYKEITDCHHDQSGEFRPSAAVPSWRHITYHKENFTHTPRAFAPKKSMKVQALKKSLEELTIEPLTSARKDEINRFILAEFPLTSEHFDFLAGEGLPEDLINYCGSFVATRSRAVAESAVAQFGKDDCQRHPAIIKDKVTGNYRLAIYPAKSGILFPAINERTGLISGLQIRDDNPATKGARYRDVSHDGLGGTPTTFFKARTQSSTLLITEGYKKAAAAVNHFGYSAISIQGVSRYDLAAILAEVTENEIETVLVAFDSDKRANSQVMLAQDNLLKALRTGNEEIKIATLEWDDKAKGLDDAIKSGSGFEYQAQLISSSMTHEAKDAALFNRRAKFALPATVVNNQIKREYLGKIALASKFVLVKSEMGSGKTTALKEVIEKARRNRQRFCFIGHRVTLMRATCSKFGIPFYQDYKESPEKREKLSKLSEFGIVINSLTDLYGYIENLMNVDIVIIDESEQVLDHLTGKLCQGSRFYLNEVLSFLLSRAKHVICLDADMSVKTYNYLSRLPKVEKARDFTVTVNTYRRGGKLFKQFPDMETLLHEVKRRIEKGERAHICCNWSKERSEALYRSLKADYPQLRAILINSETTSEGDEVISAFLANPDSEIVNYDLVVSSPSMGTGVDIQSSHIDFVALFAENGVNTHTDLHQMAARVRNPKSGQVLFYIQERVVSEEDSLLTTNPAEIYQRLLRNAVNNAATLANSERDFTPAIDFETGLHYLQRGSNEERYMWLVAESKAARNLSMLNLLENFTAKIKADGHKVIEVDGLKPEERKVIRDGLKGVVEEVEVEHRESVMTAAKISDKEAQQLQQKGVLNSEEQEKFLRHQIETFYNQEITEELYQFNGKKGEGKKAVYLAAHLMQPQRALAVDKREIETARNTKMAGIKVTTDVWGRVEVVKGARADKNIVMLTDISKMTATTTIIRDILTAAGLREASDGNETLISEFGKFTKNDLQGLVNYVIAHQIEVEDILSIKVKEDTLKANPVGFLNKVLVKLAISTETKEVRTGEKFEDENGKTVYEKVRYYWIDKDSYTRVIELAESYLEGAELRDKAAKLSAEIGEKVFADEYERTLAEWYESLEESAESEVQETDCPF